jgi:hypothetical protein
MSFATATIQGYVTWIGDRNPAGATGRSVINLYVSVPTRTKGVSTTYKLSVWDIQIDNVLKYIRKNQLITAQGTIGLETYGDKPMIRLDFASILDYGLLAITDKVSEEDRSIKSTTTEVKLKSKEITLDKNRKLVEVK